MRAAYMSEEGHYIRDYSYWVDGGMTHRSTKPPFTTWLQVLSLKVFGLNELALRLPIALCVLAMLLFFVWFSWKKLDNIYVGYCAGFVLITSLGFVREHGSRNGDQDAAMALYMIVGAMAFFSYLESNEQRQKLKWLALFTASTIAAVMTKYAFGMLFFPAFFIYAIYKKKLSSLLKSGAIWLSMLMVAVAIGAWLVYIEHQLPGFIKTALFHEMVDRYSTSYAGHKHHFFYYFEAFGSKAQFVPWLWLLPVSLFFIFSKQRSPLRDFNLLMLFCALIQVLIISFSKTKAEHYSLVAFPPMSLLAGSGLYLIGKATEGFWRERTYRPVVAGLALFIVWSFIVMPYKQVIENVYKPKANDKAMAYGYFFNKLEDDFPYTHFKVLCPEYAGQLNYYAGLFNRKKGYHIRISHMPRSVEIGDTILTCESMFTDTLVKYYELLPLDSEGQCILSIATAKRDLNKLLENEAKPSN
jgi:4-amino-4-deoxy-L-arabinose transferase-like glycosyltransferase